MSRTFSGDRSGSKTTTPCVFDDRLVRSIRRRIGELVLSASADWFDARIEGLTTDLARTAKRSGQAAAGAIGRGILQKIKAFLEGCGADLSIGPAVIENGTTPIGRRLSHRPALCFEFATPVGELIVVEFSGTGIDALEGLNPSSSAL